MPGLQPEPNGAVATLWSISLALAGCSSAGTPELPPIAAAPPAHQLDAKPAPATPTAAARYALTSTKMTPARRATLNRAGGDPSGRPPKTPGVFKIGQPYSINGRYYTPVADPTYDRVGVASWYGEAFHGKKTANGEYFDMNALTAAHPTLPLPSYAYVTNLNNQRTVLVRINDRGPYRHGRLIDLSRATARTLGFAADGTTRVRVRYVGRAPLRPVDTRERAFLTKQSWYRKLKAKPFGLGVAMAQTVLNRP